MEGPPDDEECSVCHGPFRVPCQSNCSHWFCGDCIMLVWHHGSPIQPCKCPLCRREITLLVPAEASMSQGDDSSAAEVLKKVETYNRCFGDSSGGLFQRMQDLPFFIGRLARELAHPERSLPFIIRVRVFIAIALSVVYVISPVDIVPESVLGIIGYLDDLIIVMICILHVSAIYRSVLYNRHGGSAS
ncbi:hypothetical protein MLD38_016533 [Melastoma candidum]|uniref:Uncharacterized protein n=1 Tax=Melastoma candidum TaxID=119954 RepID=A0ACB9QNY5_9MYRT|nr:hypothetical protein MLD38_016533 [Melastoma candidum]